MMGNRTRGRRGASFWRVRRGQGLPAEARGPSSRDTVQKGGRMQSNASSALEASVLVLNKLFMAIHIISVRRAFVLLCKDLAEVVHLEDGQFATYDFETWREVSEYRSKNYRQQDDDWVRTAHSEIQVPRVIRLMTYEK